MVWLRTKTRHHLTKMSTFLHYSHTQKAGFVALFLRLAGVLLPSNNGDQGQQTFLVFLSVVPFQLYMISGPQTWLLIKITWIVCSLFSYQCQERTIWDSDSVGVMLRPCLWYFLKAHQLIIMTNGRKKRGGEAHTWVGLINLFSNMQ